MINALRDSGASIGAGPVFINPMFNVLYWVVAEQKWRGKTFNSI